MYLYIIVLLIPFLYKRYTLEIIDKLSYLIALVLYYLDIRKDIIEYNLKEVFPNITINKMNKIRFKSIKYFLINVFIAINQYLFYDSFLLKYYKNKKIKFQNKSFVILLHLGIFYDFMSFIKQSNKSLYGVYKGKINLPFNNKKIKFVKHNKMNFEEIDNYYNIFTPIDQKTSRGTEIFFLNKKVNFHDILVKYSIQQKRDLYLYYCIIDEKNYKINQKIIKINYKGKDIKNLIQEIADKMTFYIKKYPNQYLWLHNRFNLNK